ITPVSRLGRLELNERGAITRRAARALVARLPQEIGERELIVIGSKLAWRGEWLRVEVIEESRGPGNCVIIEVESQRLTEVFTSFGARGVRAESVADEAVRQALEYLATEAAAD